MKAAFCVTSAIAVIALTGCGGVPDCADSDTVDLVRDIFFQQAAAGANKEQVQAVKSLFTVDVNTIQTVSQSEKPPRYTCQAQLTVKPKPEMEKFLADVSQRWMKDMKNLVQPEIDAGLLAVTSDKVEGYALFQSIFNAVTQTLAVGPDLSGFVASTSYSSQMANQDGKERHFVSAKFSDVVALGDMYVAKFVLTEGAAALKSKAPSAAAEKNAVAIEPTTTSLPTPQVAQAPAPQAAAAPAPQVVAAPAIAPAPAPAPQVLSAPAPQAVAALVAPAATGDSGTDFSPSFDCAKASNATEKLICSNRSLAQSDVELMKAYKIAQKKSEPTQLKQSQRAWMAVRNSCMDVPCVAAAYKQRLSELEVINSK